MPSGSKRRKSSKKPRPQGTPPELEAGLEEAMENSGVEVGEARIEGDPEAMAEQGLEGKGMNGEAPQERDAVCEAPKEGFQTDVAAPDQDEGGQGDPPSQADPEPEIPAGIEAEAPAMFKLQGEPAQGETEARIESPIMEFGVKTDADPEEIKPEAVPVESEPVIDATPDASPDEIKPDADTGLDEVESSKESAILERESVLDAVPIGSESGMDESSVEMETKADADSADIEREIDKGLDEFKLMKDAAPAEVESEIGEPLVEVKPEADTTPFPVEVEPETDGANPEIEEAQVEKLEMTAPADIEPETEEAPTERELETDAASADIEPATEEAPMERELETDAAPADVEAEMEEALAERELAIDAAPVDVESEMDAAPADAEAEADTAQVEIGEPLVELKPEADTTPYIELQTNDAPDEVPVEVEPETDGAPSESKPEMEEAQVEKLETTAPADIEPETEEAPMERELETDAAPAAPADAEAEAEEALAERELAMDAAPVDVDVKSGTDAAPVDTEAETDTAQVEIDASPDEIPPEIDAASPENETVEIKPDANADPVEAEQDEVFRAGIEPEVEALVEGEPEVSAEDVDNSAELKAKVEPPQETEPEPKPPDVAEDMFLEPPQEIEPDVNAAPVETEQDEVSQAWIDEAAPAPETGVEALVEGEPEVSAQDVDNSAESEAKTEPPQETEPEPKPLDVSDDTSLEPPQEVGPEYKPEDESLVETKAEERGSVETESDQQDLVEGEINPEPDVETSRGIELDAEAEVPLEAEPEPVVEAQPDEKGSIGTESDQQDLGEIEPDQSGVKEHDLQLQKQEGEAEAELGELYTSVSEDTQPSQLQLQVADASEVSVIEDEPPAISASDESNSVDDSTLSTSSSEASDNADNEKTAIEHEPEEGDYRPPSATVLEVEGESTVEGVSDNQDSGGGIEQTRGIAVDNKQGAVDELPAESEDISEDQQRVVDVGHDEDGAVLGSSGNDSETKESHEQELAPPADVEESAKEDISEQERAVDVGHDEDGAVLASAGNDGEVEVSSDQELGIELPPADVVDDEEFAKEAPPSSDQELVTEQPQPLIDEQDLSMGLGAAAVEPPSVESEQSLNATFPSSESKMTSDASEPHESACGELERDIGEEEAASSTVAEAGSVLNDFDERASYDHELPTDFPSTNQDVDIPDYKEFDDNLSTEAPESVETGFIEQLDSEPSPAEKVDACGLEATSEQQEVFLESVEAVKPAKDLHSALVEEVLIDEQPPSQPEQVVQDNGEDNVHSPKEIVLATEELRTAEEERPACEDDKVAANSILGTSLPMIAGDELISKAFTYLENGQQTLSSSEGPSNELVEHRHELSIHRDEANNPDEAEIHAMDTQELKEAEHNPMGGDTNNDAGKALAEPASLIPEGRDLKGVQTFRLESTQEPSLPVVVPAQDRALEHVSLKSAERPSGGSTLAGRTNLLGCCGMFDLLLRRK